MSCLLSFPGDIYHRHTSHWKAEIQGLTGCLLILKTRWMRNKPHAVKLHYHNKQRFPSSSCHTRQWRLLLHRPSSSTAAVACGCDMADCRSHYGNRKHFQAVCRVAVLKFVSRGARGQSVSDWNSQCLSHTTTDVMIFIERWWACVYVYIYDVTQPWLLYEPLNYKVTVKLTGDYHRQRLICAI